MHSFNRHTAKHYSKEMTDWYMKNIELKILCWAKHARPPPKNAYCTIPFVGTSKKKKFYTDRKQMSGSCGHKWGLPAVVGGDGNIFIWTVMVTQVQTFFPTTLQPHFYGLSWPANSNLLPHILHILLVSFLYTLTTICHTMFYFLLCTLYILLAQCLAHKLYKYLPN